MGVESKIESILNRVQQETGLTAEHASSVVGVIGPQLAEVYLDHYDSKKTFEKLYNVFLPVTRNLDQFAEVFDSNGFAVLRERERASRKKLGYATGVIGCIDGRVWQMAFGFPLNVSLNREPAGRLGTDLGTFTDQAFMEAVEARLRKHPDLSIVEFFTSHTSLMNQGLDEHGHTTVCGATRGQLGEDFVNHQDGGLKWDMDRKKPLIEMFQNRFTENRVRGVEAVYDTDSVGLVFGAEKIAAEFLTNDVIHEAHRKGNALFTDLYRNENYVRDVFVQGNYIQGSLHELLGKPEHLMTVLESLVGLRDALYDQLSTTLKPRLEKIYQVEGSENLLDAKMIDAVMDKIFWNIAFQHLSGWGNLHPDHPLRHHNESYVLCGPKGETNGLDHVPFWAKTDEGINIALSLFPPDDPVLVSFTEIAQDVCDEAPRAVGRAAEVIRTYINTKILQPLAGRIPFSHDSERLADFESALRRFLVDYDSPHPKLRLVLLPILLLQCDSRRILRENGGPEPGINADYVASVIPELYRTLLTCKELIESLKARKT